VVAAMMLNFTRDICAKREKNRQKTDYTDCCPGGLQDLSHFLLHGESH